MEPADPNRNSTGVGLEPIDKDLWVVEGGIVDWIGFPYSTRAVIVRLDGGDLWIWSPVKLVPQLRAAVQALGPVRHLVSPNKLHHLYLSDWLAAFPGAQLWAPRSTIRKRRDLQFREPLENQPPPAWGSAIDQAWLRGSPLLDEIVFCHRPSRTVIVADMIQTFGQSFLREHWTWWRRVVADLDGITFAKAHAPLELRLSFIDRRPARVARTRMLSWPCERVIVAHGEWRRSDGHAFLARSLAWLGP